MATAPRPPPRSRIARAAASRAVDSLLKWIRAHRNPHNTSATVHEDCIYLILTLTKPPHKLHSSKPYPIPLPHPLHDPSTVSLILDDRPNSLLSLPAARDLIRSLSLPISQLLSLSDLRSGFLPAAGELLFADRRIARLLRGVEKKGRNRKVEVDFTRKEWPEHVKRVCFSTVLRLGSGTCSGIRVGRASQGRDEIVDNLMAAAEGAVLNVPQKWSNVMGFHLKAAESVALPIYEKSDWSQKKVGDGEEDGGMEGEMHERVERRADGAIGKRTRDGGEVREIEKKILRYGVGG